MRVLVVQDHPLLAGPIVRALDSQEDLCSCIHCAEESEAALLDAIDAGAIAYLTKAATADEIVEAVRRSARC